MELLGLTYTHHEVREISKNLTRMILYVKGNNGLTDYAIYHYKCDGKMFPNWKMMYVEGDEKKRILSMMQIKYRETLLDKAGFDKNTFNRKI
jgi:hypothetical protein